MSVIVLFGIAVALVAFVIALYNRLVRLRNASESAWSDIDVQLKRRHNLIPNLVETVKGYAQHERATLENVIAARSRAESADGPAEQGGAETALGHAIGRLFALAEAYPELKANENFRELQTELSGLENAIQNARRYYNAIVRDLNTACDTVPSNFVASTFGVSKREYFELDGVEERKTPQVDFGSSG